MFHHSVLIIHFIKLYHRVYHYFNARIMLICENFNILQTSRASFNVNLIMTRVCTSTMCLWLPLLLKFFHLPLLYRRSKLLRLFCAALCLFDRIHSPFSNIYENQINIQHERENNLNDVFKLENFAPLEFFFFFFCYC